MLAKIPLHTYMFLSKKQTSIIMLFKLFFDLQIKVTHATVE